jgi:N-acetylmuramic acid 6-phosphate etherase
MASYGNHKSAEWLSREESFMKKKSAKSSPWEELSTEAINPDSLYLDTMSALQIVDLMNREDKSVIEEIKREKKNISKGIELVSDSIQNGRRIFYVGAGTSGRLGVLDASECPPTFGTDPSLVQGIIAGGPRAVWRSVEGAEDDSRAGERTVNRRVRKGDTVVGVSASSVTPFVRGALEKARAKGAKTLLVTCIPSKSFALEDVVVDVLITPVVGPEILTGSTRLKAGTATKMVLNMLSTGAMILLGKTYGNLMVDLKPWSRKLRDRAVRIVQMASGLEREAAGECLRKAGWDTKLAILMARLGVTKKEAINILTESGGDLRKAVGSAPHYAERMIDSEKK